MNQDEKAQMQAGVLAVRDALSTPGDIPNEQIEESLWYYYFDVDKTVAYLNKMLNPPEKSTRKLKEPRKATVLDNILNGSNAKPQKKQPAAKPTSDSITNGVANVRLDDTPKVKSKNIDAAAAFEKIRQKKAANFVVIGHVDHGKSTLMGRLLYDLNHLSARDHSRNQKLATETGKSSFALAWAMDSTAEERARGVTVDIATNTFSTPLTDFTILDAPGHRDFIPNMIAGAAQADFAVLVIDAATNAFEAGLKGQTREHALLVRSMGISRLVVAVNKMDAANWSQDRFNTIQQQMSGFLSSAGFSPKNIVFIPCAGLTGDNVATALDSTKAPWYKGETLIAALDASEPARRRLQDPLRLTVSDIYRTAAPGASAPVSIVGRLDAGSLQIGTVILAQPAGEVATVKNIEVDGASREYAVAGQIANVGLVGIDAIHLRAGDVVCERSSRGDGSGEMKCVRAFTAKCLAFEHVMPGPVEVLRGRLQSAARVTDLLEIVDKGNMDTGPDVKGKKKKKPRIVKPGQVVRLRVEVEAEKGLPLEAPDRVVLRSEGVTIAAGLLESVEVR